MNTRRHFLKRIAAAAVGTAAASVIDPELLAWEPGKKATFDLWMPPKKQLGISVRLVKEWEIDPNPCRLDVLYGMSVVRPELACRVAAEGDGSLEDIEGVIITNSIVSESDAQVLAKITKIREMQHSISMSGNAISVVMDP